ncbi:MAG: hypothetical protein AAGD06_02395 [Acidobacteriota bacterium]
MSKDRPHEVLTPNQTRAFEAEVLRLGFDLPTVQTTTIDTGASQDGVVVGGASSAVETKTLIVETLAQLRAEVGSDGTRQVSYPPAFPESRTRVLGGAGSADEIWRMLTSAEREHLPAARTAHLHGDPDRVAGYRELIERTQFPQTLEVHAAADVVVHPGKPLVFRGPNPISVVYGSVTVLPGGQILCETEVRITTQVFKAAA